MIAVDESDQFREIVQLAIIYVICVCVRHFNDYNPLIRGGPYISCFAILPFLLFSSCTIT